MADPRTEFRTESPRTIRDPRSPGLAPEEDDRPVTIDRPVTMPGLDEPRTDRFNQSEEGAFQSGRDTSAIDADNFDRDDAARTAIHGRTPPQIATAATAAGQSSSGDWENTPSATADQTNTGNAGVQPLFSESEISDLRSRWNNVQAGFVDSPRHCVQKADELVADVLQRLTTGFADERTSLEKQWDSGGNVSTEDLRVALQRYRSFFGRLLNAA